MAKKGWVVSWPSIDPSQEEYSGTQVYTSEAKLKDAVWSAIKALAKDERESMELDEEQNDELLEIENATDFWEAYNLWEVYAGNYDPNESVVIEDTTID